MTTIELTKEASERLIKFKELAKDRGLKRSDWMKILSEILLRSKDDLWWKLITLHTSEEYLLQEAMSDPVMKKASRLGEIKHQRFKQKPP